jgi:hypothetical protein
MVRAREKEFGKEVTENGSFVTLETQRRMRHEISNLIRIPIYPNLQDAPGVLNYPPVQGEIPLTLLSLLSSSSSLLTLHLHVVLFAHTNTGAPLCLLPFISPLFIILICRDGKKFVVFRSQQSRERGKRS